ncbi:NAD(P)H-dependent oxidoreductase [Listeria welshimeri]|uniref:flavodoxin n=1 Tax=Listeria welshimeri TaxID=1643 RepID=UPI0010E14560|nr:flavodoxin [Listeria welshimeri]EAC8476548.1 flavodoxin [Listeria monocytogenes]MBC1478825.1 flavodoxin [Listeria welshimeri]MBC1972491.1 flavodoxin [Listeria welshimeri]MBC1982108.1 flavodoxin [Listeria welshimeri]MBC1993793.1 flavodoxin [Listeria welshimeri]
MKKYFIVFFSLILILTLTACNNQQTTNSANNKQSSSNSSDKKNISDTKSLVVYFSQSGNTKTLANIIQKSTNADVFELELVQPYPDNYDQMTEQVGKEQKDHITPELSKKITDFDNYDTIFIGSPIWRSSLAPPMASFITSYNLSGKTVIPFFTSDSGTLGNSVSVINSLVSSDVQVLDALAVKGEDAAKAQSSVDTWLEKNGFVK